MAISRRKTGPNITGLKPRDLHILMQLHEKISLTADHLQKLCFEGLGKDAVYKNLAALKSRGYVEAHRYDFGRAGKLRDLHFLTAKGHNLLLHAELTTKPCQQRKAPHLIADYAHRTAIIDYWIKLEQGLGKDRDYSLGLFTPEYKKLPDGRSITLRAVIGPDHVVQIRNDAIFIVRHDKTGREYLYLLEVDRGTMPVTLSPKLKEQLRVGLPVRSTVESKLIKSRQLFARWPECVACLGPRFSHFSGARLLITNSGAQLSNLSSCFGLQCERTLI